MKMKHNMSALVLIIGFLIIVGIIVGVLFWIKSKENLTQVPMLEDCGIAVKNLLVWLNAAADEAHAMAKLSHENGFTQSADKATEAYNYYSKAADNFKKGISAYMEAAELFPNNQKALNVIKKFSKNNKSPKLPKIEC